MLVNDGSASASEIVAAALKETGRATIIGQHTYGKNTVQVWSRLENSGGVRITISRWFTPEHHSVAPDGVQPDIEVTVPAGTPPERDLYLERAIEFIDQRALGGSRSLAAASVARRRVLVGWCRALADRYDVSGLRSPRSDGPVACGAGGC